MRIGIDARYLQGPRRGQGQYVYYLIKGIAEANPDCEVVAFYNGFAKGAFAFDSVPGNLRQVWCRVPGSILKTAWSAWRAPKIEAFIGGLDVFHNPVNFSLTHYVPIPSRAPMVATFNGIADPSTMWNGCDAGKVDAWLHEMARRAQLVIAVSEMAKSDFIRRTGYPEERVRIVHYGVSGEFRPMTDTAATEAVLRKYGLAGKRYLFYAGGAEPNKNLARLIDAFGMFSRGPAASGLLLVLAGEIDANYRDMALRAAGAGLADRVRLTGYVGHDDLPYVYSAAAAFVLPTIVENFGIPVLEAMACGVPAAVSRGIGAIEAVGDCVAAFDPFDPGDIARALNLVLADEGLRARLRSTGRERAGRLTWSRTAEKTMAVYREALGRGRL
jgi:glycosyltransferase involved in cell wall biosynthesis